MNRANNTILGGDYIDGYNISLIDLDRLQFPQEIAHIIGARKETINFWKKKGCPFLNRKTTIRWVREFMAKEVGVVSPYSTP